MLAWIRGSLPPLLGIALFAWGIADDREAAVAAGAVLALAAVLLEPTRSTIALPRVEGIGGWGLLGVGLVLIGVGVFDDRAEALALRTLVATLGVVLDRVEGPIKIGASGLEATLRKLAPTLTQSAEAAEQIVKDV